MQAIENAEIDLPPVMIEQELDHLLEDMGQRLQMQGMSLEQYLEYTGGTLEELRKNYRDRAEVMCKRELVMEAVVKAEDIQVTEEEFDKQLAEMAENYKMSVESIREALQQEDRAEDYKYGMKMQKAMDLIYDNAVITEEAIDREELKAKAAARASVKEAAIEMAEEAAAAEIVQEAAEESGETVEADVKDAE